MLGSKRGILAPLHRWVFGVAAATSMIAGNASAFVPTVADIGGVKLDMTLSEAKAAIVEKYGARTAMAEEVVQSYMGTDLTYEKLSFNRIAVYLINGDPSQPPRVYFVQALGGSASPNEFFAAAVKKYGAPVSGDTEGRGAGFTASWCFPNGARQVCPLYFEANSNALNLGSYGGDDAAIQAAQKRVRPKAPSF